MLRERSIQIAEEQRRQRRALILFAAAALVLLSLCLVIGVRLLAPPTPQIPVGFVSDYIGNQPRRFSVPMLKVSTLIQRRERSISEDTIYVRRESDGSWVALLGVDTLSGCFLYWDDQAGLYRDINCLGSRYTPDGRYLDGLITGEQPQNMARLPVDVRDGQVFVRDELMRER
jgi:Rieske Fe-S protein